MARATLNDMLSGSIQRCLKGKRVVVELSPEIKEEYEYEDSNMLYVGIYNLVSETKDYRGNDIKLVTRVDEGKEIVELFSSGSPLPAHTVSYLNRCYERGRKLATCPTSQGSEIAAYHLSKCGAAVSIENTGEPIYTVKNKIIFGEKVCKTGAA